MAMNQDGRSISIDAPLKDAFMVQGFSGEEAVNSLYEFRVDLLSDKDTIDPAQLVGKAACLTIASPKPGVQRFVHGFIRRLGTGGIQDDGLRRYQLTLVPGLWLLTQNAHYRIFSQQKVTDVVKTLVSPLSQFMALDMKVNGATPVREHITQLGESDFEFLHRILEEEGLSYFFIHQNGSHKMVVTDNANAYGSCADGQLIYTPSTASPYDAHISEWQREISYHTGVYKVTDYNDITPDANQLKSINTVNSLPNQTRHTREVWGAYKFPFDADAQHKFDTGHNQNLAKAMMQAEEARYAVALGRSDAPTLSPGSSFTLQHLVSAENGEYVVTRVMHAGSNEGDSTYQNTFECVPARTILRPLRSHPPRTVNGPLTATVTEVKATSSGGDKLLLVKVAFPWLSDLKTCWLRVSQLYAGNNWGSVFVPRVTQEVIVNFIDGNPDRPIITGALYNGTHAAPPYTVTQSGIRTESKNYNELRFDDKQDAEEVYFQAGKNLNVLVKHDEKRTVQNAHSTTVKQGDHTTLVEKGHIFVTVSEGNQDTKVNKGNQTLMVEGNQEGQINGNRTMTVKGNQQHKISGDLSEQVQGTSTSKVTGAYTVKTDNSAKVQAAQTITLQANQAIELKVGGSTIKITPTEITLKMGANSVKIDATGVTAKGTMVKVNGDAMTEVKAGGMLTLKGGVTMIN